MTEFRDAVEKRRGLQAYEEWAKQLNYHHYNDYISTKDINDGPRGSR